MVLGYGGSYRAVVIDTMDPLDERRVRVRVRVPEVYGDDQDVWAQPSPSLGHAAVPEVGTHVWIEYEGGDVEHPVWEGVR